MNPNLMKLLLALTIFMNCSSSDAQEQDRDKIDKCILEQHKIVLEDLNKNENSASNSEKIKYWIALAKIYHSGDFSEANKLLPHTDRIYDFCENRNTTDKSSERSGFTIRNGDSFFEPEFHDYKKAYFFYRRAHEEKNMEGTIGLVWLNLSGKGIPKNLSAALEFGLLAAKSNRKDAQHIVGALYAGYDGESFIGKVAMPGGLKPNLVLSYMWLNIAVSNGHEDAYYWRKNVEKEMDTKSIEQAQRYSSICVLSDFKRCADGSIGDLFK